MCGVRYGAMLALPVWKWPLHRVESTPKPLIFAPQCAPPMCWCHTLLLWTTLRLGWACISSGEGPSSGVWAEIGAKRPNYGLNCTVRSDTLFSNRLYLHCIVRRIMVRYCNLRSRIWSTAYFDKPDWISHWLHEYSGIPKALNCHIFAVCIL